MTGTDWSASRSDKSGAAGENGAGRLQKKGFAVAALFLAFMTPGLAAETKGGGKPAAAPEAADEQSSEDVFGFTQGSDIAKKGEVGLSFELGGAFGRRAVRFRNLDLKTQIGFGVTDWLAIGPAVTFAERRFVDDSVPVSTHRSDLGGAGIEVRMRLLDRRQAPVGVTLTVEPGFSHLDDVGARTQAWGVATKLTFDRGFLDDAVILGGNLIWEPEWEKAQGATAWARGANAGFGAAAAFRLMPGVYAGLEARALWAYGSLGFTNEAGRALYLGPTFIAQINERFTVSAAWNAQVSGRARGDTRDFDLTNFERHVGKVKLAIGF